MKGRLLISIPLISALISVFISPLAHAKDSTPIPSKSPQSAPQLSRSEIDRAWDQTEAALDREIAAGLGTDKDGTPIKVNTTIPSSAYRKNAGSTTLSSSNPCGEGNYGTGRRDGAVGRYPTRPGVILVTPDWLCGLIATGHAGIILNFRQIVESNEKGVQKLPNFWFRKKRQVYGVTTRGTTTAQDRQAALWASSQTGKPYNYNLYNIYDRDRYYCSQLVWASFYHNYWIDLNTTDYDAYPFGVRVPAVHPMELMNTPKTRLIYRMR